MGRIAHKVLETIPFSKNGNTYKGISWDKNNLILI